MGRPFVRGKFITFEGPEGSGKSTHLTCLAEFLRSRGLKVVTTREPGGTPLAETVRGLLRDISDDAPVPRAETLLFLAARAQVVTNVIRPTLDAGTWILCDRFIDSTLAYQGAGRGFDINLLKKLNEFATGGLTPDLTLLLDVPPEVSRQRLSARQAATATSADRIESAGADFHTRLRECFLQLAAAEPNRFEVIDSSGSSEDVSAAIEAAVVGRLRA